MKTYWDLDKTPIECQGCGINAELYDIENEILCKPCALKEEICEEDD